MIQSFRHADFDALAKLWSSYFPSQYRVDPDLLRLNTVECPVFDWGASLIHAPDGPPLGFVVVKKSAQGVLYEGIRNDDAFLCAIAYEKPQVAIDLLAQVKAVLRDRGARKLHFGQDAWHFFPGCPVDHSPLKDLLEVEGFTEGEFAFDMEREIADYSLTDVLPEGYAARPLTESELPALEALLVREFPGRWVYDVLEKVRGEECPECIVGLFFGEELVGFARLQKWDDRIPMAGGVWRASLGEHWGSLGPIGIAEEHRGKGLGHGLLAASLDYLRGLGVQRCLIDWTKEDRLYRDHGFQVTRTYRAMHLDLESLPSVHAPNWDIGLH